MYLDDIEYYERYNSLSSKEKAEYRKEYWDRQNEKCDICRKALTDPIEDYYNKLDNDEAMATIDGHIDHCHKTDIVRGLLCGSCNKGLGFFKDSPNLLYKASDYLSKNS